MSNIAISEITNVVSTLGDDDLLLVSKAGDNTYTSSKLTYATLVNNLKNSGIGNSDLYLEEFKVGHNYPQFSMNITYYVGMFTRYNDKLYQCIAQTTGQQIPTHTSYFTEIDESIDNKLCSNWYKVYSNGWCEMGGNSYYDGFVNGYPANITFPIPFRDTLYFLINGPVSSRTRYGFTYANASIGDWAAWGYIR